MAVDAHDAPLVQLVKVKLHKGVALRELVLKARWRRRRVAAGVVETGTSDALVIITSETKEEVSNETET